MIKLEKVTRKALIDLLVEKGVGLEGNITKLIDGEDDDDFQEYLKTCKQKDVESRKKRLEVTKQVQQQNKELSDLNEANQKIMEELQTTLKEAENQKLLIETQNHELIDWKKENEKIQIELQNEMVKSEEARITAESAKKNAENDLDLLQKKTQNELASIIVKVAIWVILSAGVITTLMYMMALYTKQDTQIIGSTWSNMFSILLTNAFSIVGTIMGIKYATGNKENNGG
jgi:hypothetical protein